MKDAIRKASLQAAQTLARDALALSTHEEVEALLAANSKRVDRPGDGRSV